MLYLCYEQNVHDFQRPHHIIFNLGCQCESRKKSAYQKGLYLLKTHDFYYDLPEELIAQTPLERRDASRLMTLDRKTGAITHRHFYDLLELLQPGDCLVMNNSRVLPARLLGHRFRPAVLLRCCCCRIRATAFGNASQSRGAKHMLGPNCHSETAS